MGLAALVALHYLSPGRRMPYSIVTLLLAFCVFAGVGIERSLHLLFGWNLDPKRRFLKDKRTAELRLGRLHEFAGEGLFDPARVKRLAERIALEELFGATRARGPRGPYKKRLPPQLPGPAGRIPPETGHPGSAPDLP